MTPKYYLLPKGRKLLQNRPVAPTPEVRHVLSRRSVRNKIGVPVDCRLCPVGLLPVVSHLVAAGYLVWLDRATLMHIIEPDTRAPVLVDIYLLTPKGVAFCDEHAIEAQDP